MSAKGRGGESREYDYYPTPHWCVDRLLDRHGAELLRGFDVLEPTVGDGAIVRAVEAWLDGAGDTAMLLRVGFLGASERTDFWRTVGVDPVVRVLPDRPSFDGEGTDSATYAWFIWGADLSGPRVDVLDETPIAVRRAAAEAARLIDAPDPRQVSLFGEVA